ncbi:hypothetical protein CgunFtcFv8_018375 [Champsocephalus gunnari]|uniref:Uncharacterized protein n=1 Tax=Champsocephalus gunnari TaxID=52237 RepID=A0AAN8GX00_CHAGU|nr:hypothetical protein CgunFtcFv8_018375 [Champsocephalus gunnari]
MYLKLSDPMSAGWNASAPAAHMAGLINGCCRRTLGHGNRRLHNNDNPAVRVERCPRCEDTNKRECKKS